MKTSETQQQATVPSSMMVCGRAFLPWSVLFAVFSLSAFSLPAAVPKEVGWRVPEAEVRIRTGVATARSHMLRVDLPKGLPGKRPGKVIAYSGTGKQLSATLCPTGPETMSVEVMVSWISRQSRTGTSGFPVEIYLLGQDSNPSGEAPAPAPADRKAVQLHRLPTYLITRPFSAKEFRRMIARYSTLSRRYSYDVSEIGEVFDKENWKQPPERRSAFLRWACTVPFVEPGRIRVGADTENVAWFVFLDGKSIAEWRVGPILKDDSLVGEGRSVDPGLHALEVFAIQRHGEPIPKFRVETSVGEGKYEPMTGAHVLSSRHADNCIVETKGGDVLGTVAIDDVRTVFLRSCDRFVTLFSDVSGEEETPGEKVSCTFREAVNFAGNHWGIEGIQVPEVDVKAMNGAVITFPARGVWVSGGALNAYLRPSGVPVVVASDGPVSGDFVVRMDVDDGEDELLRTLDVSVCAESSDGVVESGGRQIFGWTGKPVPFSAVITEKTSRIVARCTLAGVPATRDVLIHIVRPDGFENIVAQGNAVFRGADTAVLVCSPIAEIDIRLPKEKRQIGLLDDYVACSNAPEASLLPEKIMAEQLAETSEVGTVCRHSIGDESAHGTRPATAKFAALSSLLDLGPDVAVLGVGASDLLDGISAGEICLQLLYMCQAAADRGTLPVLVALPPLRGVSKARSREAALLVKELAWRLSVPVLDLYSLDNLSGPNSRPFCNSYTAAGGTVTLDTPNNHGRRWVAVQLANELAEALATCDLE